MISEFETCSTSSRVHRRIVSSVAGARSLLSHSLWRRQQAARQVTGLPHAAVLSFHLSSIYGKRQVYPAGLSRSKAWRFTVFLFCLCSDDLLFLSGIPYSELFSTVPQLGLSLTLCPALDHSSYLSDPLAASVPGELLALRQAS